jgi:hypothetical protein
MNHHDDGPLSLIVQNVYLLADPPVALRAMVILRAFSGTMEGLAPFSPVGSALWCAALELKMSEDPTGSALAMELMVSQLAAADTSGRFSDEMRQRAREAVMSVRARASRELARRYRRSHRGQGRRQRTTS